MAVAAASSSSSMATEKHDVFLSFRGEDTRYNFTSHLYTALKRIQVVTYIDNQLIRGEQISCGLLKAIEESKLWIVIFSQNYASSSWCLDELLHILECDHKLGRVVPVFYHVDPSCVRKQGESYEKALDDLAKRYDADKLAKWKDALTKAADLSGWSTKDSRSESELVEKIVGDIIKKLNNMAPHIAFEGLVGVHQPIQQIESLLDIGPDDVRIIAIWGLAGIGKTTLAHAVFDKLVHCFEAHFFLENVREKWGKCREECRNKLYSVLLGEKNAVSWSTYDKVRLSRKRVLIVLDDVNDQEQLEYFVGSHKYLVGSGSRIIVTSRDRQSFGNRDIAVYEVEGLKYDEAHQLFCLNAFKRSSLVPHSKELLERVVNHAEGIPLAIKVLASLFSSKSKEQWGSLLAQQKASPNEKIQNILQISYDGLNENQQNIFLDIACFFKGCDRYYVQGVIDRPGVFADIGIQDLVDKSLITISYDNRLCMHDLIQQMGWEIIRLQSPKEPGKRSRLFMAQDIYHVLKYNNASALIEGISLDTSEIKDVDLSPHVFRNAYNLRLLKIFRPRFAIYGCRVNLPQGLHSLPDALKCLSWDAYPSKSLPSDFAPENLVELRMPNSQVKRLWDGVRDLPNLKYIDLSFSMNLIEMPDLSQAPNLEVLTLRGCRNFNKFPKIENIADLDLSETAIEELPESIGFSGNRCKLRLIGCESLQNIPSNIFQWESLEELVLTGCSSLKKIPDFPRLLLEDSELKENLHVPMDSSEELDESTVEGCISLKIGICQLKSLVFLSLSGCSSLEKIPELPRTLACLYLCGTTIEEVPSSIELLSDLRDLNLRNCKRLRSLPTSICKLQSLAFLVLHGCSKFENFPEILKPMKGLCYLYLSETGIKDLPSSIENLVSLQFLSLGFCTNLKFVPISIYKLQKLTELELSGFSELLNCHSPTVARFANLKQLILSDSDMFEIPDNLLRIPDCYLSGKRVDTPRMKFLTLEFFSIRNCKNLRSLPELPFNIEILDARGCTSLETVSRSSIAIPYQYWREYSFGECVLFLNCVKLNESARSNIIADAQLRILRLATKLLGTFEMLVEYNTKSAYICYPGNEIPEWYNYQASGSSINVVLPLNWFDSNFLGFTLCFVAAFKEHNYCLSNLRFECEIHLKTDTDESHKSKYVLCANNIAMIESDEATIVNSDHVFFMYDPRIWKACKAVEGTITEVSFHFCPVHIDYFSGNKTPIDSSEVKRCGIRLLYRQEADEHCPSDPDYWKSDDHLLYRQEADEHFASDSDYWKSDEEDSDSISEEIAEPSGSKLVLEYDRENEGDERPSKSEIVEEFGFAGDHDVAGESIAREDDVVNNSSSSRGSENLLELEATDNSDESKLSISCGCLLFLSHVREHVLRWIFRNTIFKGALGSSSTTDS